ncbi:MAG: hypothetical protein IJU52_00790 [Clostridia bacterium]|nr:hypothetical protein [Clostridia bacterium]
MQKEYALAGIKTDSDALRAERALYGTGVVLYAEIDRARETARVFLPEGPVDEDLLFSSVEAAGLHLCCSGAQEQPAKSGKARKKRRGAPALAYTAGIFLLLLLLLVLPIPRARGMRAAYLLYAAVYAPRLRRDLPLLYSFFAGKRASDALFAGAAAAALPAMLFSGIPPAAACAPALLKDFRDASASLVKYRGGPRADSAYVSLLTRLSLPLFCLFSAAALYISKDPATVFCAAYFFLLSLCSLECILFLISPGTTVRR